MSNSIREWNQTHKPQVLYARDAIHDPYTLEAFLKLFRKMKNLKTAYIVSHFPTGVKEAQGEGTSIAYRIK